MGRYGGQLKDVRPVYLNKWPVVEHSIIATDEKRTRVYIRGKDFHVIMIRGIQNRAPTRARIVLLGISNRT